MRRVAAVRAVLCHQAGIRQGLRAQPSWQAPTPEKLEIRNSKPETNKKHQNSNVRNVSCVDFALFWISFLWSFELVWCFEFPASRLAADPTPIAVWVPPSCSLNAWRTFTQKRRDGVARESGGICESSRFARIIHRRGRRDRGEREREEKEEEVGKDGELQREARYTDCRSKSAGFLVSPLSSQYFALYAFWAV